MPALPISPYAVGKLAAEGYCRAFSEVYDLETVCLRYFNVFGPRQDPLSQYAAVIPNFITRLPRDEPPTVFGDGEQTRDFTYVDNVVQANVLAADAVKVSGRTFNVAVGSSISLNQIIDQLRQLTGLDLEPIYLAKRPGDVPHSLADISRAARDLGYAAEVRFEEGLQRTLEFQRSLPSPVSGRERATALGVVCSASDRWCPVLPGWRLSDLVHVLAQLPESVRLDLEGDGRPARHGRPLSLAYGLGDRVSLTEAAVPYSLALSRRLAPRARMGGTRLARRPARDDGRDGGVALAIGYGAAGPRRRMTSTWADTASRS